MYVPIINQTPKCSAVTVVGSCLFCLFLFHCLEHKSSRYFFFSLKLFNIFRFGSFIDYYAVWVLLVVEGCTGILTCVNFVWILVKKFRIDNLTPSFLFFNTYTIFFCEHIIPAYYICAFWRCLVYDHPAIECLANAVPCVNDPVNAIEHIRWIDGWHWKGQNVMNTI